MNPIPVTLNHIALDVADRARSAAFYGALLGARVVATDEAHRLSFLRLPGSPNFSDIALHEHPDRDAAYPAGQIRMAHTGFAVEEGSSLVDAYDFFTANTRLLLCADFGVSLSVIGFDPDGNVVEFELFKVGAIDEQPGFEPLDAAGLRARVEQRVAATVS